ncbi:MAG: permease [Actinomycetota bacterium]
MRDLRRLPSDTRRVGARPHTGPLDFGPAHRSTAVPELIALGLLALVLLPTQFRWLLESPGMRNWVTVFVAIFVQALPFLVLGVLLSGGIAALVPPGWLASHLPKNPLLAVPVAGVAGVALPGCECGSVPIAGRLMASGAPPAAATAFLLSAPAINPVVLVATAVAFQGQPQFVVARFAGSLATAVITGLIWAKVGKPVFHERAMRRVVDGGSRWATFSGTAQHDFLHAGGFLVLGGMTAATLHTVVPKSVLDGLAGSGFGAVLALAVLAFVLAICSEADAFVAASLSQFSPTARLVFMVVGPAVDVKLVALQAGTFGKSFAIRFAPITFVVAIACGVIAGSLLL